MEINEEFKNVSDVIKNLLSIGNAYTKLGNFDKAHEYLNKAYKLSFDIKSKDDIFLSSGNLSTLFEKTSNYNKALEYYKQYEDYKDSVKNEQTMNFFNISQAKSENELSQTQNKLLNTQKELQERQNSQLRLTIYLFIAVFIFYFLNHDFPSDSARTMKKKKSKPGTGFEDNTIISEQKKEITHSIHYASRIQRAVLPPKEYLNKILRIILYCLNQGI